MSSQYQYEVKEMVESFDFQKFLSPSKDQRELLGAWMIVTDSQCAFGNNDYGGKGYHGDSLRKAFCEILEEERMSPYVTPSMTQKNYIIGIMFANNSTCNILFNLDYLDGITHNQLALFKKFANKYNDMIRDKANELNQNLVIIEENGKEFAFRDLEPLCNFLESKINDKKVLLPDVNIISNITLEEKAIGKEK